MQNNEQDTFTVEHIDKNHTSLNAFSFEQNEFKNLFSEKFRMLYTSNPFDLIALSPCGNYMLLHGDNSVMVCDLQKVICSKINLSQYAKKTYLENNICFVYNMYLTADGFIIVFPDGVQTKKVIYFKYKRKLQ